MLISCYNIISWFYEIQSYTIFHHLGWTWCRRGAWCPCSPQPWPRWRHRHETRWSAGLLKDIQLSQPGRCPDDGWGCWCHLNQWWINGESMVNHMTQILDCDYRDYDHDSFDSQQNRWLNPWLAMPGFCGSFVSGNQWAHCASLDMERYGIAKARVLPLPVLES